MPEPNDLQVTIKKTSPISFLWVVVDRTTGEVVDANTTLSEEGAREAAKNAILATTGRSTDTQRLSADEVMGNGHDEAA
jgi:hypothetical protein